MTNKTKIAVQQIRARLTELETSYDAEIAAAVAIQQAACRQAGLRLTAERSAIKERYRSPREVLQQQLKGAERAAAHFEG